MRLNTMVLALAFLLFGGQGVLANDAVGVWFTEDGEAKVKLSECGNTLCSEIVWLKEARDENGKPLRDAYNPDPSKRNRKIMGLEILKDLEPVGHNQWSGEIYNPENGKTYKAKLTVTKPNQIVLKGCTQWGWPCGQKIWRRAEPRRQDSQIANQTQNRPDPRQRGRQQSMASAAPGQNASSPAQQEGASGQTPSGAESEPSESARTAKVPPPDQAPRPPAAGNNKPSANGRTDLPWQTQSQTGPQARQQDAPGATAALPERRAIPQPGGDYVVQVAARQNHSEALRAFRDLQKQFPQFLGGLQPDIQKVDLGFKGIWYRVRVGPLAQKSAAFNFCQQLKAAGGDCLVRRR